METVWMEFAMFVRGNR